MKTYEIEKRGNKKFTVVEIEGGERKDLQPFRTKAVAELHITRLMAEQPTEQSTEEAATVEPATTEPAPEAPQAEVSGLQAQPDVEVPKVKKLSANQFVGKYLIAYPEASEDQVKTALSEAGLKLNEYALHAWVKDWKWIVPALEEAGWKRPATN